MSNSIWKARLQQDLWTLHEAACFFAEVEPITTSRDVAEKQVLGENATTTQGEIYRRLKDALISQTAPIVHLGGWYGFARIKPVDAVKWAISKDIPVPSVILDAMPSEPKRETSAEKGIRLAEEKAKLRARKTKNWLAVLVQQEDIGRTRIKDLIAEAEGRTRAPKPSNPYAQLMANSSGHRGQKKRK